MPKANGEFVKIYLYLLGRCQSGKAKMELSPLQIHLTARKRTILRALRYWKESGIMDVSFDQAGNVTKVRFAVPESKLPAYETKPSAPAVLPEQTPGSEGQEEVRQLLFIAEQYLGRTLTPTDVETLLYLYDEVTYIRRASGISDRILCFQRQSFYGLYQEGRAVLGLSRKSPP